MRIGIVGATGYGGSDLLRLLHQHPEINEIVVYSSSQEGMNIHESYPHRDLVVLIIDGPV